MSEHGPSARLIVGYVGSVASAFLFGVVSTIAVLGPSTSDIAGVDSVAPERVTFASVASIADPASVSEPTTAPAPDATTEARAFETKPQPKEAVSVAVMASNVSLVDASSDLTGHDFTNPVAEPTAQPPNTPAIQLGDGVATESPLVIAATTPNRYSLQVGSFNDPSNASSFADRLNAADLPSAINVEGPWSVVSVGPFNAPEAAAKAAGEIRRRFLIEPILRRVRPVL